MQSSYCVTHNNRDGHLILIIRCPSNRVTQSTYKYNLFAFASFTQPIKLYYLIEIEGYMYLFINNNTIIRYPRDLLKKISWNFNKSFKKMSLQSLQPVFITVIHVR